MKYTRFCLSLILVSLSSQMISQSISAQDKNGRCTLGRKVAPAKQLKEVVNQEFGFSFKVPSNYTSEITPSEKLDKSYSKLLYPIPEGVTKPSKT